MELPKIKVQVPLKMMSVKKYLLNVKKMPRFSSIPELLGNSTTGRQMTKVRLTTLERSRLDTFM